MLLFASTLALATPWGQDNGRLEVRPLFYGYRPSSDADFDLQQAAQQNHHSLGTGLAWHAPGPLTLEANFGLYPYVSRMRWTTSGSPNHIVGDVSNVTWFAQTGLLFAPWTGQLMFGPTRHTTFDLFVGAGGGLARTVDDLELLQAQGEPRAVATQFQVQPTLNLAAGSHLFLGPRSALRADLRHMRWAETIASEQVEVMGRTSLELSLSLFPGGG